MRVLVTSTPGTGHLHPLVPLARELVLAGHEVVWATAASSCAKVESYGFPAVPCGLDGNARLPVFLERAAHFRELPPRQGRAVQFPVLFGEVAAPVMRDDLVEVFDDFRPQLVVHEFAELAAAPMATARGIATVSVGFSGAVSDDLQAALEESVAPVWEREGLSVDAAGINGDLFLHPFPAALDTPREDGPSAPMRPLSFDGAPSAAPPGWISTFGAERPGVYVTFGTEVAGRAPWTAILEALADLDVDVVATVGGRLDPETLGPLAANTRVERYVPQSFILERSKLVISHGGAGTLIGAATTGKVQLGVPIAADQWENADLLAAANAGVVLEPDERDADTIRQSVQALLADVAKHADAELLRAEFAAMPHPAALVASVEQLARA
jgi:UDP:flavonoid glycosyltransferase YjiC (YdhE family)